MGLITIRKAQESLDLIKLKWLLLNPLSRSVTAELVQCSDGRYKAEDLLDSYPDKPAGLSWVGFQASSRILNVIGRAMGSQTDLTELFSQPAIRRTALNTLLTLHEYGVQQPQRFYSPLMVVWNITWRCNLRCKHCYENAGALRGASGRRELTLEQKLAVIGEIGDSLIPTLSFSGGEPLSAPDFWQVAEAGRAKGLYMSLNTNGTLLNSDTAQKLADLDFAYAGISLDAPNEEQHDAFRGVPGSWRKTVEGIKNLVKTDVSTILSVTLTKLNYQALPAMFKLASELGMDKVMVYNFIPTGRGKDNQSLDLTPEEREEALGMMYDHAASGGSLCSTAPQFGRTCYERGDPTVFPLAHTGPGRERDLHILSQLVGGCGVGRAYIALQPDGTITPCVYMPEVEIGNIKRDRILDIWQNNDLIASLASHDSLKGSCGKCEHKVVCGGCRARAYSYFGDFHGPDPGCIKNKDYSPREADAVRESIKT